MNGEKKTMSLLEENEENIVPSSSKIYKLIVSFLKRIYLVSEQHNRLFFFIVAAMLIGSGYLALIFAPTVKSESFSAPQAQRILYFHVPSAWVALLAFTLVFVASMLFLKSGQIFWDRIAYASAEVGVLFCTVAILTGPFWAKAEWGVYWRNDPKLTVTFVLWLIYIGYLIFRNTSEEEEPELASILSIFGFITVPLTFLASRVLTSSHPNVVGGEGSLGGEMVFALLFSLAAFTLLFYYFLVKRYTLLKIKGEIEDLKTSVGVMLNE